MNVQPVSLARSPIGHGRAHLLNRQMSGSRLRGPFSAARPWQGRPTTEEPSAPISLGTTGSRSGSVRPGDAGCGRRSAAKRRSVSTRELPIIKRRAAESRDSASRSRRNHASSGTLKPTFRRPRHLGGEVACGHLLDDPRLVCPPFLYLQRAGQSEHGSTTSRWSRNGGRTQARRTSTSSRSTGAGCRRARSPGPAAPFV